MKCKMPLNVNYSFLQKREKKEQSQNANYNAPMGTAVFFS